MANNRLTKTYDAEGAIGAYSIVKPGANDFGVVAAAAATDKLMGVTTEIAAAIGERADVVKTGTAYVLLGGVVAAGDPITSDANAKGVKAAPVAGSNDRIVGFAEVAGIAGDVIEVMLALGEIQG